MKQLLLAILFATSAATAFSDTDAEPEQRPARETFESRCDAGVSMAIYSLARLEMIEVDNLLEKKKQIASACKTVSDEDISRVLAMDAAEKRIILAGARLVVDAAKLDQEIRNGKFLKAMTYLIRERQNCQCDRLEEDLENFERLAKNDGATSYGGKYETWTRDSEARMREYTFVDACQKGKVFGHQVLDSNSQPTDAERKGFSQECAGLYAQADVRKIFDPMQSEDDLMYEGCRMGAERVHRDKGLELTPQQSFEHRRRCSSIPASDRMLAEHAAAHEEWKRALSPEESFWQRLRDAG